MIWVPLIIGFRIRMRYSLVTTVFLNCLILFSIFCLILISISISRTGIFLSSSASTDLTSNIHSVFTQLGMTTFAALPYDFQFHLLAFLFSFSNSILAPSKLQLLLPHLVSISQFFGYQHTVSSLFISIFIFIHLFLPIFSRDVHIIF